MKKETNIKLLDEVASKEEKLKKQHGEVIKLVFTLKDKPLTAYLKQPDIITLDAVMTTMQSAPLSSSIGLFKNCWVDGDVELLQACETNSGLGVAISKQMQLVIPNVSVSSTML